ncbi:MAG: family 10 glycosylhydrolase [Verrucomicrobiota bacterium]
MRFSYFLTQHIPRPFFLLVSLLISQGVWANQWLPAPDLQAPEPQREFRAAWIASVYNIDWPSKAGLSTEQQQQELRKLFDLASEMKLNAVILQVRPAADALYQSRFEPWSYYLTGKMGREPDPFYDPLSFAIKEAHLRGLELHAWINPFRALTNIELFVSEDHISKTNPDWIRPVKKMQWLNPADSEARRHSLRVVADLVIRYPIDGIHIDDYFYPYPENTKNGQVFNDDLHWKKYQESGGTLDRNAWRRGEINHFVQSFSKTAKHHRPTIKVGISPFGIWRPRHPETVIAYLDAFEHLAADSKHWFQSGWVDYLSPQLYWPTTSDEQNFYELLDWWKEQNTAGRHLWPGIASARVGSKRPASEMQKQVEAVRNNEDTSPGHIHWSISALAENKRGVTDLLKKTVYQNSALIPESPWIPSPPSPRPMIRIENNRLSLASASSGFPSWWLIQTQKEKESSAWNHRLVPGNATALRLPPDTSSVSVRALNAAGKLGPHSSLIRQ